MKTKSNPLTPAQRGQLGGLTTATRHDTRAINAKARKAFRDSFAENIREEHPDLPEAEVQRRADAARKLHYKQLAYKSAETRRKIAEARRALRNQRKGGQDG